MQSRRDWLRWAMGAAAGTAGPGYLFTAREFGPAGDKRPAHGAPGFQIHGGKPHDHVVRFRTVELL